MLASRTGIGDPFIDILLNQVAATIALPPDRFFHVSLLFSNPPLPPLCLKGDWGLSFLGNEAQVFNHIHVGPDIPALGSQVIADQEAVRTCREYP